MDKTVLNRTIFRLTLMMCMSTVITMATQPPNNTDPGGGKDIAEMAPKMSSARPKTINKDLLKITGNPLREQPNLSRPSKKSKNKLIRGSKRVVTLTRMKYLRKDWCKTEPFTQIIREDGCLKRKILNRFCYGQCNSFFIPKSNKANDLSAAFQSCSVCLPKKWSWVSFTLRCPGERPRIKRKKIQVVKQCRCMAKTLSQPTVGDSDRDTEPIHSGDDSGKQL